MATFTATAEPNHVPPRVRLDFDTQDPTTAFSALEVRRNGELIRSQPPVGSSVSVTYDYEAPFADAQTYTVSGTILATGVADWTENWASLASWTGDTAQWAVASGKATSQTGAAKLVRSSTGTIQKVVVATPVQVRVELLNSSDVVVASIQIDSKATLTTSTGSTQVAGTGGYTLVISGGIVTVTGSTWSVSRSYAGTPVKVRLVALTPTATQTSSWSSAAANRAAVDSAGNVYVIDTTNNLVRKFSSAGVPITTWSTTGAPFAIAIDSSNNVFVLDFTNSVVRKYSSTGVPSTTFAVTASSGNGMALDSSGNFYIVDTVNSLIRKYSSAGVAGITWSTTGSPYDVAIDSSNNVYVTDISSKIIRKYSTTGVAGITWSTVGQPFRVATDGTNVYVVDSANKLVRKYTAAGAAIASWSSVESSDGVAVDSSSNVYTTDSSTSVVRKFAQASTSIGQIIETPAGTSLTYDQVDVETLNAMAAWLIHPAFPDLSTCIDTGVQRLDGLYADTASADTISRGRKGEVFSPIGRSRDVVITNGNRREGDWSLVLYAPRIQDRDLIIAECADQTPLLLRVPPAFGWDLPDGYYSVGDVNDQRTLDRGSKIRRTLTLPLTPVDAPLVTQAAQWTYGDVLSTYSTYGDVRNTFSTYLDLLVGPQ